MPINVHMLICHLVMFAVLMILADIYLRHTE